MTTPVGRAELFVTHAKDFPVLGSPASLMGSEFPQSTLLRPFLALPRPDDPTIWASPFWSTWPVWGGAMRDSVWGPGSLQYPLQYNQPRSPGRLWFPHPPPTGVLLMYSLGVRRGGLYIRQRSQARSWPGSVVFVDIYPTPQDVVGPSPRGVKGLRSPSHASRRAIYARSCKWTSGNSPSAH